MWCFNIFSHFISNWPNTVFKMYFSSTLLIFPSTIWVQNSFWLWLTNPFPSQKSHYSYPKRTVKSLTFSLSTTDTTKFAWCLAYFNCIGRKAHTKYPIIITSPNKTLHKQGSSSNWYTKLTRQGIPSSVKPPYHTVLLPLEDGEEHEGEGEVGKCGYWLGIDAKKTEKK